MDNARRKMITRLINALQNDSPNLQWAEQKLLGLLSKEEDARDNTPDVFQDGEQYEICEESIDLLSSAIEAFDLCENEDYGDIIKYLQQINGI